MAGDDSQQAWGPVQLGFWLWSAGLQRVQGGHGHNGGDPSLGGEMNPGGDGGLLGSPN